MTVSKRQEARPLASFLGWPLAVEALKLGMFPLKLTVLDRDYK